ncbi:MAG: CoB--CoM heterodisulfide reductase iron-sulfur subunit D [Candidatus Bathyarchaeota archaeon BA1]|nr:MAG: CoB--CoM heterodisulfide reductase iron-sulfur subunit D [Candidatus Bathyarchaeota archaeon BA1]
MPQLLTLKDYEEKVYLCNRCGFCRPPCPVMLQRGMEETTGPRGRMLLIYGLMSKELKPSASITEKVYLCTTCRYCYVKCPAGLDVDRIVEAARHELVKTGMAPPEVHKVIASRINNYNNPFGEPSAGRIKWLGREDVTMFPERAKALYWVGCMASYRVQDTVITTVKILKHANADFTMLGTEEGCCGSVLLRTGQRNPVVEKYSKRNVEMISARGVKTLITSCAGCFRTFYKDYPEILGELPFEVLHSSQYFERLVRDGAIEFKEELPMKVTYHDPCHMGRHVGVYDAPRNVIKAIPGVKLVEMATTREEARCCGAGGGLRSGFRELSITIAVDRLKTDALPTGAEAVVTPCPFCILNFEDAVRDHGMKIEVLDLTELVSKALRIQPRM